MDILTVLNYQGSKKNLLEFIHKSLSFYIDDNDIILDIFSGTAPFRRMLLSLPVPDPVVSGQLLLAFAPLLPNMYIDRYYHMFLFATCQSFFRHYFTKILYFRNLS